jgi:FkbM family methyltransferase
MILPVLQGPLRGKRWIVDAASHACWFGSYELQESELLSRGIQAGQTVFDLGAQAGYHTLHAATLVGPHGRVYAFEPNPLNVGYLRKHIALNRMSNIVVIEAAVADFDGLSSFDERHNCFSGRLSENGAISVRTICLDKEVREDRLAMPDYLKIDVEGAEVKVLQGAVEILRKRHPTLLVETHEWIPGFASAREECWCLLAGLGYELEWLPDHHIYGRASTLHATKAQLADSLGAAGLGSRRSSVRQR